MVRRIQLEYEDIIGLVAGALTTFSFAPQVWRLFKLKSAREISLTFNLLIMSGVACWTVYGVLLDLLPVILWNAITLALLSSMFFAKLRYGLRSKS
jgi:MtN3 and saliva related transmembrane protein